MRLFLVAFVAVQIFEISSLVIPDELPSLLSVVYSNIPTIKKGTDSRLGWGFRLGNRADFQVLVELGPQLNTQPLANQPDNKNNKRAVENNLRNQLWALRQKEKREKQKISNTDGGKWIEKWSETMKNTEENENVPLEPRPGLGIGEIDAKSVIPEDSELKIEEKTEKFIEYSSTRKPQTTTSKKDALDNVEIDDKKK